MAGHTQLLLKYGADNASPRRHVVSGYRPRAFPKEENSCPIGFMSGGLTKAVYPGMSSDTRRIVQVYAVRMSDEVAALAAVAERTGAVELSPETLSQLADDVLEGIGLTDEGQIGLVQCIF